MNIITQSNIICTVVSNKSIRYFFDCLYYFLEEEEAFVLFCCFLVLVSFSGCSDGRRKRWDIFFFFFFFFFFLVLLCVHFSLFFLFVFSADKEGVSEGIKDGKIVVLFRNTGNAPQLKQKKFKLSVSVKFGYVAEFLRKQLRFKAEDPLFLFVSGTFQPHPDETVLDLYLCFHDHTGKLVVNYCSQQAWG